MLELVELAGWPGASRPSSPAVSSSASRWPARCQPAQGAAAGRAAGRARPQAAPADAAGAQADPDRGRHHLRPRHPRPGRGHDHGRHHRGDERRAASSRLGAPAELYENPPPPSSPTSSASRTCSRGEVVGTGRRRARRRRPRARRRLPTRSRRVRRTGDSGRRPPGEDPSRAGEAAGRRRRNPLDRRSSPTRRSSGCRTQYLVRMPWGQELASSSRTSARDAGSPPATEVDLHWDPEHTFAARRRAGRRRRCRGRRRGRPPMAAASAEALGSDAAARAPRRRRPSAAQALDPYFLLLPGHALAGRLLRRCRCLPGLDTSLQTGDRWRRASC